MCNHIRFKHQQLLRVLDLAKFFDSSRQSETGSSTNAKFTELLYNFELKLHKKFFYAPFTIIHDTQIFLTVAKVNMFVNNSQMGMFARHYIL